MSKLITLETWLERTYEEPRPSIFTARRWARNGNITPLPQKHGRTYYVQPDATYRQIHSQARAPRLIDKIIAQRKSRG